MSLRCKHMQIKLAFQSPEFLYGLFTWGSWLKGLLYSVIFFSTHDWSFCWCFSGFFQCQNTGVSPYPYLFLEVSVSIQKHLVKHLRNKQFWSFKFHSLVNSMMYVVRPFRPFSLIVVRMEDMHLFSVFLLYILLASNHLVIIMRSLLFCHLSYQCFYSCNPYFDE